MRWEGLFDDLEAQVDALAVAERAAEIETRTRGEVSSLAIGNRLRPAIGSELMLRAMGDVAIRGRLARVGPDWLLLDEQGGREVILATAHLISVRGLARYSAVPATESAVAARLGLRHALRGIARDRSAVRLHLTTGQVVDATIDRVGADFVEVATHSPSEPRRRNEVRDVELIAMTAVVAVRRSV